jgi:hypothetical protein
MMMVVMSVRNANILALFFCAADFDGYMRPFYPAFY